MNINLLPKKLQSYLILHQLGLQPDNIIQLEESEIAILTKYFKRSSKKSIAELKEDPLINFGYIKQYDKKAVDEVNKDFEDFLEAYRTIFQGIRKNSKGNLQSVRKKLKNWLITNPNVSRNIILLLAQSHVDSNGQYAKNADYYILKRENKDGIFFTNSQLSNDLEEYNDSLGFSETL